MKNLTETQLYQKYFSRIEPSLLIYLVMVVNVKMVVKIPALILLVIFYFKSLSVPEVKKKPFLWFYVILILLTGINFFSNLTGNINIPFIVVNATAVFYWVFMLISSAVLYQIVQTKDAAKLHNTVSVFFMLNLAVTAIEFLYILADVNFSNPYTDQSGFQKYFINTGDLIRGLSFDVSTTNAIICSFGLLYFFYRHKYLLSVLSVVGLLLTTSNITNLLMIGLLLLIFVFFSTRVQKSIICMQLIIMFIFFAKVSPHNTNYIFAKIENILNRKIYTITIQNQTPRYTLRDIADSLLTAEDLQRKKITLYLDSISSVEKNRLVLNSTTKKDTSISKKIEKIPEVNVHTEFYQRKTDTIKRGKFESIKQEIINNEVAGNTKTNADSVFEKLAQKPGKLTSFRQTYKYLKENPGKMLTGAGAANFSSKLAFRATALNLAGGYPQKWAYKHPEFAANHLLLYINCFAVDEQQHSVVNTPNSVYNQLAGEYGLAGFISFLVLYIGYFALRMNFRNYAFPLVLVLLFIFLLDYFFEQLSVVLLFELLMFLDIKKKSENA
jgi:hypothetical protein